MGRWIWLGLMACNGGDTDVPFVPPPELCGELPDLPDAPYFTEVTDEAGLSTLRGTRLSAVDVDGDGWTDLIVHTGATNTVQDAANDGFSTRLLHNDGGVFTDITAASGLTSDADGGLTRSMHLTVWGDVDNDGDLDAFSGYFRDRNADDTWPGFVHEVLLNDGAGHFSLAPPSDASFASSLAGATFVDFDRDGILDLWLVSWYEKYGYLPADQHRLLRGVGDGSFTDVTDDVGLTMAKTTTATLLDGTGRRPGFGATACDVDDDGDPDLLASIYGRGRNQLWQNDGGDFTDIGAESGFAGDESLDYSDNMFYRCWCEENGCDPDPGASSLGPCSTYADYWTDGFDDQPARLNGNTFTTVCADVDNDGDRDLYNAEIVHWHIGDSSDRSELLVNNGDATFTRPGNDVTGLERRRRGQWNEGDLMAAMFDFDSDGWKDVLLLSSDYPDTHAWLFWQRDALAFDDRSTEAGLDQDVAAGVAIADFDRDGDLDVAMGTSTARGGSPESFVRLYRNDLVPPNTLRLVLEGTTANRSAIGAEVTVEADGVVQTYEVGGGYGHMGIQNDLALVIGLGEACTADKVTVRWPDGAGTTDAWETVRAGYLTTLTQGGGITYEER